MVEAAVGPAPRAVLRAVMPPLLPLLPPTVLLAPSASDARKTVSLESWKKGESASKAYRSLDASSGFVAAEALVTLSGFASAHMEIMAWRARVFRSL